MLSGMTPIDATECTTLGSSYCLSGVANIEQAADMTVSCVCEPVASDDPPEPECGDNSLVLCDGMCVDIQFDDQMCGIDCSTVVSCDATETCLDGICLPR